MRVLVCLLAVGMLCSGARAQDKVIADEKVDPAKAIEKAVADLKVSLEATEASIQKSVEGTIKSSEKSLVETIKKGQDKTAAQLEVMLKKILKVMEIGSPVTCTALCPIDGAWYPVTINGRGGQITFNQLENRCLSHQARHSGEQVAKGNAAKIPEYVLVAADPRNPKAPLKEEGKIVGASVDNSCKD